MSDIVEQVKLMQEERKAQEKQMQEERKARGKRIQEETEVQEKRMQDLIMRLAATPATTTSAVQRSVYFTLHPSTQHESYGRTTGPDSTHLWVPASSQRRTWHRFC